MKFTMKRVTVKSSNTGCFGTFMFNQEINVDQQATWNQLGWAQFLIRHSLSAYDTFHGRPNFCSWCARSYISGQLPSQIQRGRRIARPDLNMCESVGAIMKDRVGLILQEPHSSPIFSCRFGENQSSASEHVATPRLWSYSSCLWGAWRKHNLLNFVPVNHQVKSLNLKKNFIYISLLVCPVQASG